jgi:hypothetical protein
MEQADEAEAHKNDAGDARPEKPRKGGECDDPNHAIRDAAAFFLMARHGRSSCKAAKVNRVSADAG